MNEMDVDDILTTVFIAAFLITALEFLLLGLLKIYEFYLGSATIFWLSVIPLVVTIVSLAILLIKK
ncbi:MAG: hypothetical protein OH319_00760 [Candidatus Parvarchaeota archaeon]|nr:hypothetical protein [Candidatus Jingweiarchaeum tengchongense]MCW1305156.1 hypothetical protein [Candidatus Jingweiarchaeum tengchongense]MCW1310736.1 hypothetical protein [Candidatus Jingweiarchaeum tengchongense]